MISDGKNTEAHLLALSRSHRDMRRSLEDVESHMNKMHGLFRELLTSRRWRTGSAVAAAIDRVMRNADDSTPEERITLMLQEGERLLNRAKQRAGENIRSRFLGDIQSPDPINTWLCNSLTQPMMSAPYSPHEQQVIQFMQVETARRAICVRDNLPPVSIVMPTYQRAHVIRSAIESVLAQTHSDWELIIVDDGSTDGTADVIAQYSDQRLSFTSLPLNRGVSAARNHALRLATGDVVAYLDSDNYWDPEYLRLVADSFAREDATTATYTAQTIVARSDRGEADGVTELGMRYTPFHRSLLENRSYIDLNCFAHRKQLFDDKGGFDESLPRLVDWDLILRYSADRPPVGIPCPVSTYVFGAVADQLTHVHSSKEATDKLDRNLFGGRAVDLEFPVNAPSVHRDVALRPNESNSASPTRDVSVIVVDEGRGWGATCLQALKLGFGDAVPTEIVIDAPSELVAAKWPEIASRLNCISGSLTWAHAVEAANRSPGADLLVITSDALVMPGSVAALQRCLASDAPIGISVPRRTITPYTDHYGAHADHHKPERELDITISATLRNVVDPLANTSEGYMELSHSAMFCMLVAHDLAAELDVPIPIQSGDVDQVRALFDVVRVPLNRTVMYVPAAKVYHLV